MLHETNEVIKKYLEFRDWDKTSIFVIEENIIQKQSISSRKRVFVELKRRIESLTSDQLEFLNTNLKYKDNDYYLKATDLNGIGKSKGISLAVFISLCSGILERPILSQTVILGSFSIGGTVIGTDSLPDALQIASDAGAKKVLIPVVDMIHIEKVPPELLNKFQLLIYSDPIDAVFKAIGVN